MKALVCTLVGIDYLKKVEEACHTLHYENDKIDRTIAYTAENVDPRHAVDVDTQLTTVHYSFRIRRIGDEVRVRPEMTVEW